MSKDVYIYKKNCKKVIKNGFIGEFRNVMFKF